MAASKWNAGRRNRIRAGMALVLVVNPQLPVKSPNLGNTTSERVNEGHFSRTWVLREVAAMLRAGQIRSPARK